MPKIMQHLPRYIHVNYKNTYTCHTKCRNLRCCISKSIFQGCDPETEFECISNIIDTNEGSSDYGGIEYETKCIPNGKKCDGINDCSDGSDEDISICGKFLNLITQYLLKY